MDETGRHRRKELPEELAAINSAELDADDNEVTVNRDEDDQRAAYREAHTPRERRSWLPIPPLLPLTDGIRRWLWEHQPATAAAAAAAVTVTGGVSAVVIAGLPPERDRWPGPATATAASAGPPPRTVTVTPPIGHTPGRAEPYSPTAPAGVTPTGRTPGTPARVTPSPSGSSPQPQAAPTGPAPSPAPSPSPFPAPDQEPDPEPDREKADREDREDHAGKRRPPGRSKGN